MFSGIFWYKLVKGNRLGDWFDLHECSVRIECLLLMVNAKITLFFAEKRFSRYFGVSVSRKSTVRQASVKHFFRLGKVQFRSMISSFRYSLPWLRRCSVWLSPTFSKTRTPKCTPVLIRKISLSPHHAVPLYKLGIRNFIQYEVCEIYASHVCSGRNQPGTEGSEAKAGRKISYYLESQFASSAKPSKTLSETWYSSWNLATELSPSRIR